MGVHGVPQGARGARTGRTPPELYPLRPILPQAKAACEGDPCRRCVRLGKKCVPQERPPPGKRRRNNRGAPTDPVVVVQPRDRFAQAPGPVPVLAGPPMVGLPIGAVPGVGKPVGYSAPA